MSAQKKVIISCSEETENAFDVLKEKFEFFEDLLKRTNCSFEKQEKLLCEDLVRKHLTNCSYEKKDNFLLVSRTKDNSKHNIESIHFSDYYRNRSRVFYNLTLEFNSSKSDEDFFVKFLRTEVRNDKIKFNYELESEDKIIRLVYDNEKQIYDTFYSSVNIVNYLNHKLYNHEELDFVREEYFIESQDEMRRRYKSSMRAVDSQIVSVTDDLSSSSVTDDLSSQ